MAVTYLEISYPNFVLGAIIDPEEANQNNHDFQTKINDTITAHNLLKVQADGIEASKATKVYADSILAGLTTHKTSSDHDGRYYTETEIDSKLSVINNNVSNNSVALINHKSSADHDNRYYTKEYLIPWMKGGDTDIKEEVFVIVNPNLGDGTFTYTSGGQTHYGTLTDTGEQIFNLTKGFYETGKNRVEVMINDTLRRSVASGGLREDNGYNVILTSPEGAGAEVTVKYYERVGMAAEYNIRLSATKPPVRNGTTMWFEVM